MKGSYPESSNAGKICLIRDINDENLKDNEEPTKQEPINITIKGHLYLTKTIVQEGSFYDVKRLYTSAVWYTALASCVVVYSTLSP